MNIEICRIDAGRNIDDRNLRWLVQAINSFEKYVNKSFAIQNAGNLSNAFSYYALPAFTTNGYNTQFVFNQDSLLEANRNRLQGNANPAALASYCRKHGLLYDNDSFFCLSEIGRLLLNREIDTCEYALILLSKQWIRVDNVCKRNLLAFLYECITTDNSFLALLSRASNNAVREELQKYFFKKITGKDFDSSSDKKEFSRFDILQNALLFSGILSKIDDALIIEENALNILKVFYDNEEKMIRYERDSNFLEHMCDSHIGIVEIIDNNNANIIGRLFPNLIKLKHKQYQPFNSTSMSLQRIYYGAPGTGKSHEIKKYTKGKDVIRTTFHPDSDYSTFVGCYKPTKDENGGITYDFSPQAFTKAYVSAWKKLHDDNEQEKDVFLIIEEINRGNCAQIFGDLFQLLDRDDEGYSEYVIEPDSDLQKHLEKEFKDYVVPTIIKDGSKMALPPNLYIWATMNTSDQSLFPIDSAFKRRWNWKYTPIKNAKKEHYIRVDDSTAYDWWEFLEKINERIEKLTESEDKKLGYWFAHPEKGNEIKLETFVSKVIFYLWNDVFKDFGTDSNSPFIIKNENGEVSNKLRFHSFFDEEGNEKADMVKDFIENLKVERKNLSDFIQESTTPAEVVSSNENNDIESLEIENDVVEDTQSEETTVQEDEEETTQGELFNQTVEAEETPSDEPIEEIQAESTDNKEKSEGAKNLLKKFLGK